MARALIGVGSNINPEENVLKALGLLKRYAPIKAISTVYLSEADGRPDAPCFYNCVVAVESVASPDELKYRFLRSIEEAMGRRRESDKDAPRTVDLDLLLYDDVVISTVHLRLPDPEILRRPYIAWPVYEIAPELVLPGLDISIKEAAHALPKDRMKPLPNYTEMLRSELLKG